MSGHPLIYVTVSSIIMALDYYAEMIEAIQPIITHDVIGNAMQLFSKIIAHLATHGFSD